jgi:hypothetical protein
MDDLNKKFNLPATTTISEPKVPMKIDDDGNSDFDYVRRNIYDGIEIGASALAELAEIAKSSQNARAYEVLGIFMERYANINKDLYNLHKQKKELTFDPSSVINHNVTNNNVNLTTKELQELLSKKPSES